MEDVVHPLDDLQNKVVRTVVHLQQSRTAREKTGQSVLEGPHLILEALAARSRMRAILYSGRLMERPDGPDLLRRVMGGSARTVYVTDRVLDHVSDVETHQGIVAVADLSLPVSASIEEGSTLVVASVQDPGNLGGLIRTAAAFGFRVALAPGTVDPLNPKSLRASAGAIFRTQVKILERLWDYSPNVSLVVADPRGSLDYRAWDWRRPTVLVVGNEGAGVDPDLVGKATARLNIQTTPGTESLNVSVAAGIIMAEAFRQQQRGLPTDSVS